jgi:[ribosomal protein S18]-alanine N-acetyltransferase
MMGLLSRLFAAAPVIALAGLDDAANLAALHAASFGRGWTEDEFEQLLLDRRVVGQRAALGREVVGFVISRIVEAEAEILSVAVACSWRGRGLAGQLLDAHLRMLAGRGTRTVFLEVEDGNTHARRLYARRHFRQVDARKGYYPQPEGGSTALILRCDLAPALPDAMAPPRCD